MPRSRRSARCHPVITLVLVLPVLLALGWIFVILTRVNDIPNTHDKADRPPSRQSMMVDSVPHKKFSEGVSQADLAITLNNTSQKAHHNNPISANRQKRETAQATPAGANDPQSAKGEAAAYEVTKPPNVLKTSFTWKMHKGKSCQGYADGDATGRTLEASKTACMSNDACVSIECPRGSVSRDCTLRQSTVLVDYFPADCYERLEIDEKGKIVSYKLHPAYQDLLREYPFQQVTTQHGRQVNIILVRSQMSAEQQRMVKKYGDEILFMGISSMNDYPIGTEFVNSFPGWLYMMREPEKHFPPQVKTLLMSQSDFALPDYPERDYSVPKKYDFTYSGSDCDVHNDCQGWCGWSKNWSFVKEALVVMCGEYKMTGVLVATKDKADRMACSIPPSCHGKIKQTTYLQNQADYFEYLKRSRFAFLPQVHDASPRVSTQALALDVPVLMNWHIGGGWKYVNEKTGEFFHDMSDFRQSLEKILKYSDVPRHYEPRKWVLENYGNKNSGKRLLEFVQEHFSDRVQLPKGTKLLLT